MYASFNDSKISPMGFGGGGNTREGFHFLSTTAIGGGVNFPSFLIFSIILILLCADAAFVADAPNRSTKDCNLAASARFLSYSAVIGYEKMTRDKQHYGIHVIEERHTSCTFSAKRFFIQVLAIRAGGKCD
jgi:hypothetical protein